MARWFTRFHLAMVLLWLAIAVPGLLIWRDTVAFVVVMSLWANLAAHFAAYQGARAEQSNADVADVVRVEAKLDELIAALGSTAVTRD